MCLCYHAAYFDWGAVIEMINVPLAVGSNLSALTAVYIIWENASVFIYITMLKRQKKRRKTKLLEELQSETLQWNKSN